MKSIELRAAEFALDAHDFDCGNCDTCSKCKDFRKYVDIATEQRKIDIDKACEWLRSRNVLTEASIEGFRKVLEEEL